MADPRSIILQQDVGIVIRQSRASFDVIILDVDNGPSALTTGSNRWLYSFEGLRLALVALKPGGCLAVWSASPDPEFEKRMARAGFQVHVRRMVEAAREFQIAMTWQGRVNRRLSP